MALRQPKPFLDRLRLRNHTVGRERRRNLGKMILEHGTPLPLPVDYVDIDKAFFEWVDKKLELTYDGKKLPSYKLFSNQKISEYSQTWSNLDENNNIVMNFKTITRENNPQHGEQQGGNYNIPGNRNYPVFFVPVLQENGTEAYDLYSMKEPYAVNFMYSVSLICNKYELLNEMNSLIQYEFNALECYLFPNKHPMPMIIENISDESEYSIDDRKFYAQTYQIKLMGYIIRKDGFKVTRVPSRFVVRMEGMKDKTTRKEHKHDNWLGIASDKLLFAENFDEINKLDTVPDALTQTDECGNINGRFDTPTLPDGEDYVEPDCCMDKEDDKYGYKRIKFIIEFPTCKELVFEFESDVSFDVDEIETNNIHDFIIFVNNKKVDYENGFDIKIGDIIKIKISREDEYKDSIMYISGLDYESKFLINGNYDKPEDEPVTHEEIYLNKKDAED